MNAVFTTPEASPDCSGATSHRVERHPRADAEQDHAREDVDDEAPAHRRAREEREPDRRHEQPGGQRTLDAEAHHELRGEPEREGAHDHVGGQEGQADLERAVPQHELEVQRGHEEPREHRGRPEDARDVRGRDAAELEDAERHQRRFDTRLNRDEEGKQCDRAAEQAERLPRRPPCLVAVHDRVDGEHQRTRHGHRAGDVDAPVRGRDVLGRQEAKREHEHGDADRQVDEEDPVPIERVREHTAEQHADASAAGHHESEYAHRLRTLGGLGEQEHDQREGDRGDDRAAEPLHGARALEHARRVREAAGERGGREQRDTREEQPPVAEQVSEPAAEEKEPAERQQVRVHDPGE
jgi:hypothetical protein